MKDNLSIVVTMLIFVILIVIFPLYNYFERQDDMSYNLALKATTNFVDEVLENGYITQDMYKEYTSELANTGNIYDIQLEAHKKVLTNNLANSNNYDEQFKIEYNKDILADNSDAENIMDASIVKGNAYYLNEGDQFYVKMNNSNTTMAGAIFNTIVPTASKERISVNYGGVVKNQAWEKVDAKYYDLANIVVDCPDVSYKSKTINNTTTYDFNGEPEDGITLIPSGNADDNIKLVADGPEDNKSWWNKLVGHTWELTGPGITGSKKTNTQIGEEYTLSFDNFSVEGDYILKVRGTDSINETNATEIKITVTKQLSGGTGEGGFTSKQVLNKQTDEFLNAYPKKLHLEIYLGNTGHNFSGDIVKIFGIKSDGTEENILDTTMGVIAKKDSKNYVKKFKSDKVITKTNIVLLDSYTYERCGI